MAQLTLLMAALLLLVESQASDVADRSTLQGFLSKSKFITPSLNRVKHGNGAEALSTKDVNPPTIADSSNPITLSAIGIGLLSLATLLGVRLQRGLQPATIIASSGGLGPLMPVNTASALGDNVMEMQLPAVPETRPAQQGQSNRVGWGQVSPQDSCPLPRVALNSIKINTRQGESVDSVIMRLRREVNKSGHLRTLRHKRFHEDAREKKKRKVAEARRKLKFMRQRKRRSMQQGP